MVGAAQEPPAHDTSQNTPRPFPNEIAPQILTFTP